jgi:hypothetical protein
MRHVASRAIRVLGMVQIRAYHRIRRIAITQNSPKDQQLTCSTARAFQQQDAQQQVQQGAQLISFWAGRVLRMVQIRAYHRIRRITFTQNSPRDLQQTCDTARAFQQHVAQQQAQQDAQHIPSRKWSEMVEACGNSGFHANDSHANDLAGISRPIRNGNAAWRMRCSILHRQAEWSILQGDNRWKARRRRADLTREIWISISLVRDRLVRVESPRLRLCNLAIKQQQHSSKDSSKIAYWHHREPALAQQTGQLGSVSGRPFRDRARPEQAAPTDPSAAPSLARRQRGGAAWRANGRPAWLRS